MNKDAFELTNFKWFLLLKYLGELFVSLRFYLINGSTLVNYPAYYRYVLNFFLLNNSLKNVQYQGSHVSLFSIMTGAQQLQVQVVE